MIFKKPKEEETVSCETCKHLIRKADAQVVEKEYGGHYFGGYLYFCLEHQKPYEKVYDKHSISRYRLATNYFRTLEVSEDGTPIGYVKKVEEKKTDEK